MTREEAINTILYHKHNVKDGSMIDDALNMAVFALEQPEYKNQLIRCEDCVYYWGDQYLTCSRMMPDDYCSRAERKINFNYNRTGE